MAIVTSNCDPFQYKYDNASPPSAIMDISNSGDSVTAKFGTGNIYLGNDDNKALIGHTLIGSGIIINYGTVDVSFSSYVDIDFSKDFTSTNYSITFSTDNSTPLAISYNNKATTGITANFLSFTGKLSFIAVGY